MSMTSSSNEHLLEEKRLIKAVPYEKIDDNFNSLLEDTDKK